MGRRAHHHRRRGQRLRLRAGLHRGAARLLFALSRDEVGPSPLGAISPRTGVPARSTAAVVIGAYAIMALGWFAFGVALFDLFVASGTIGTLILLLVYALATIGAAKLSFFSGERRVAAWEIVVPFLALVVIGYTLFRNVYPYPTEAARWYPIIAAGVVARSWSPSSATRRHSAPARGFWPRRGLATNQDGGLEHVAPA